MKSNITRFDPRIKKKIEFIKKEDRYFNRSKSGNGKKSVKRTIPLTIAFYWVYWTWIKDISIRRCKAEDCPKIFIPARLDHVFCSKRCAKRAWAQRQ